MDDSYLYLKSFFITLFIAFGIIVACIFISNKIFESKTELTIEDINRIEKPMGYTYRVTEGNEVIKEGTFFYNKKLKNLEGLVPHHYTILRTTSGPEDDMIYTLCDTNSDGSEYVLFITNPKDKQHFVACGVQEDNKYYLYTFIY